MTRRRSLITIVRRTVDLALVGLVAVVLVGVFLGRVVPLSGRQSLIIAGPSMEPTIPIGSVAVIEALVDRGPAVGDVVAIRVGPQSAIFTHRVVRVLQIDGVPHIETKGDANPAPDPATTPAAAILGRVGWSLPYAGYLLALLSVPVGIVFVLGLGLSLILLAVILETFEPIGPAGATGTVSGASGGSIGSARSPDADAPQPVGPQVVPAPPAPVEGIPAGASATVADDPRPPARSIPDPTMLEGRVARHLAARPRAARRRRPV